jgi:hypothetical protein
MPPLAIEQRWDELLKEAETVASENWLNRNLLPLSSVVPDFEVRKIQAVTAALSLAAIEAAAETDLTAEPNRALGSEVPVATPDGQASGRIDAVFPTEQGPVIRDYKSGSIYEQSGQAAALKTEYATQLKLYAAIYEAMTGVWPVRLEVVPIAGAPESVPFTKDECRQLLQRALQVREEINAIVTSPTPLGARVEQLAKPNPSVCVFCGYRPYCTPYARAQTPDADWPLDIHGKLVDLRVLGNGRRMITVAVRDTTIHIRGIDSSRERHPALDSAVLGESIGCYNLRRAGGPTSFSEGLFTVFYRERELITDT